jgi:virginiamycin B lyase
MPRYIVRPWWTIPGRGTLGLLLVMLLAACAPGSPGGTSAPGSPGGTSSFPKDKLSVLSVPSPYALPGQIVRGPDGNLWFSLEGADASYNALGAISRITPQGTISIEPLGKFAVPADMTIGPDHNLWFTTGFEVGRVTPEGQARLFDPDPKASAGNRVEMGGITTGPDGALWFATANVEVGRVTTSGVFSFYPLPYAADFDHSLSSLTRGQLKGIVTGADGALWLTDGGQVGRFE